jgi:hypothetical protein
MAGAYRVLVFTILQIFCIIGFIYEVISIMETQELNGRHLTFSEATRFALMNDLLPNLHEDKNSEKDKQMNDQIPEGGNDTDQLVQESVKEEEAKKSMPIEITEVKNTSNAPKLGEKSMSLDSNVDLYPTMDIITRKLRPVYNVHSMNRATLRDRYLLNKLKIEFRMSLDIQDDKVDTNKYMYGALYACVGMLLWKYKWITHILIIPLVYYIAKQLGHYFGFWAIIYRQYDSVMQASKIWCLERHQALLPSNIRGLYRVSIIIDVKLRDVLKGSVDAVATTAVIFGLIIFTTCASIFITIQVQQFIFLLCKSIFDFIN